MSCKDKTISYYIIKEGEETIISLNGRNTKETKQKVVDTLINVFGEENVRNVWKPNVIKVKNKNNLNIRSVLIMYNESATKTKRSYKTNNTTGTRIEMTQEEFESMKEIREKYNMTYKEMLLFCVNELKEKEIKCNNVRCNNE